MDDKVKLVSITKPLVAGIDTAEELIAYCARVSNPKNQLNNATSAKLIKYCMDNQHWSIAEMADMCVEITTTRAIAQQILRHRSFCFQEFSQRYAENKLGFIASEARRQDVKNRQNSIDDMSEQDQFWWHSAQAKVYSDSYRLYKEALSRGIAKECARMLLPLNIATKLYMKGSVRSWIHYCKVRCHESTQKEHRDIALQVKEILINNFPTLEGVLQDEQ